MIIGVCRSAKSKTLTPGGYEFSFRKNLFRACRHRTFFRNWPHFDRTSVFQTWELFGDGNRFLEAVHRQQEVSADGFLRFRERAVHNLAVFPREDLPIVGKRLSALDFAGCAQLFKPRLELAQDLLDFFKRSVVLPFAAAN